MKILIAEDDPQMVILYKIIFKEDDLTIALDGEAFMELYDDTFDSLVLDVKMPRKSGYDVLNYLEIVNSLKPITIVSAISKEVFEKLYKGKLDYMFFQKPVKLKKLKQFICRSV
jgi:DNA-binding response OmpR family regulator